MGLSLEHEEHAEHEEHEEHEEQRAAVAPPAALEENGELEFVYGVNGVETRALDKSVNEEELGVFISVTSDLKHAAKVSTVAFGLACTNISRCGLACTNISRCLPGVSLFGLPVPCSRHRVIWPCCGRRCCIMGSRAEKPRQEIWRFLSHPVT